MTLRISLGCGALKVKTHVKFAFGTSPNVVGQFTAFESAIILADVVIRPYNFVFIAVIL